MRTVKTPFVGSANTAYSQILATNRLLNLYAEKGSDGSKDVAALFGCPGLLLSNTLGSGPIRGLHRVDNVNLLYVVSGSNFYSLDLNFNATLISTAVTGSGQVSMADNGTQIFLACNPDGFIYNVNTLAFVQITDVDFPGAIMVDYIKGYFVFNQPSTQKFWITSLLDGTAVDPLDFASAEGAPDLLIGLIVDHEEVWMFGKNSTEVFYVTSDTSVFPLQRMQGAFIEQGAAAAFSVAKVDNSIFWLGSNDRGAGVVWRANGYTPVRVSTHALENAFRKYSALSDAIAYSYQESGHSFYVLTFPTDSKTWVYDAATGWWHERAYLNPATATLERHRSNCHAYFSGVHVVGDYVNGKVYFLDQETYADNGDPLKWLRSWRSGQNDKTHYELHIQGEVGVGLVSGQGSDPQIMLRWSDDGGYNWSNEHWAAVQGAIGARSARMRFLRLGKPHAPDDRVYELSGTDPVKRAFLGADLKVG